jgi:hypothetical protein
MVTPQTLINNPVLVVTIAVEEYVLNVFNDSVTNEPIIGMFCWISLFIGSDKSLL